MAQYTLTPSSPNQAESICNYASQKVVTDATAAADYTVTVGFVPRYIRWLNVTDAVQWEWLDGMSLTAQTMKLNGTGPTYALGTTDVIVNNNDGTFTVKANIIVASKTHVWQAWG
jgi:hypothetical protein